MPQYNMLAVLVAAFVPMLIGFIWYHPKVLGTAWMNAAGLSEEQLKSGGNMALIFILSLVFSFLIAVSMQYVVIHQFHYYSIFAGDPGARDATSELSKSTEAFMAINGDKFRTFKHGAFHGFFVAITMIFPVMAINAMFERKTWKYIWLNWGYWAVSFLIMGGIICAWK